MWMVEEAFFNITKTLTMSNQTTVHTKISKLTQLLTLCFLLLLTGIFWGNWFSISRSFGTFSLPEYIHIAKTINQNLEIPMRFISILSIVFMCLSMGFYSHKRSTGFYLGIVSIAFILTAVLVTLVAEVPINNQVITWTQASAPSNWEIIRDRWQMFNIVRTGAALAGFGVFAISIIMPF
jgi:uncharacterized membrane protein